MSIASRMTDTVVIQTPNPVTTPDIYGGEDESASDYWQGAESRAFVWPASSGEDEIDRETVTRAFEVYLPPRTEITANSRVVITLDNDELTCRVLGAPQAYNFRGRRSHIVARVEAVEG